MMMGNEERSSSSSSELIAFFDLETRRLDGEKWVIVEFGAILVCPRTLVQVGPPYSTFVRPSHDLMPLLDTISDRTNGITRPAIASAPSFAEVADHIYDLLHGRVWAGHNIEDFDCGLIKEAFAKINRAAPRYRFLIDTYPLLEKWFGKRAGNLKLETLGSYFGYGDHEAHRSLDDLSTNLNVLKHCAAVLFLESNFPNLIPENTWLFPEHISEKSISAILSPFIDGNPKIRIMHEDGPLQIQCRRTKVLYGIKNNFHDQRFSFVVVAPLSLCNVIDACDHHAQRVFMELGSASKWLPAVKGSNHPTIRLRLPAKVKDGVVQWETRIWKRHGSSPMEIVEETEIDSGKLEMLVGPEDYVDAHFSFDTYDYKKMAGIRLVANKLYIHSC